MKIIVDELPISCRVCFFGEYNGYVRNEGEDIIYKCKIITKVNKKGEYSRLEDCPLGILPII